MINRCVFLSSFLFSFVGFVLPAWWPSWLGPPTRDAMINLNQILLLWLRLAPPPPPPFPPPPLVRSHHPPIHPSPKKKPCACVFCCSRVHEVGPQVAGAARLLDERPVQGRRLVGHLFCVCRGSLRRVGRSCVDVSGRRRMRGTGQTSFIFPLTLFIGVFLPYLLRLEGDVRGADLGLGQRDLAQARHALLAA